MPDWGKQVGPLPLGAWVAVVGGGLGIAWYSRSRTSKAPTVVEDTSGTPGVGDGSVSQWIQTSAPATTVAPTPTTNEEWARAAINYLIAQGYDASLADTAIRKYLESTQLSVSERVMVTLALAKLGAPPVPLPAPPPLTDIPKQTVTPPPTTTNPVPTTPAPTTAPPKSTGRWVIVTKWPGTPYDSLWAIAAAFYGHGYDYPRIFNANRRGVTRPDGSPGFIVNPNLIHPGERIFVPD